MMSQLQRYEMLVLGSAKAANFWPATWPNRDIAPGDRPQIGRPLLPNANSLPSKNEIWSAKIADLVHHCVVLRH